MQILMDFQGFELRKEQYSEDLSNRALKNRVTTTTKNVVGCKYVLYEPQGQWVNLVKLFFVNDQNSCEYLPTIWPKVNQQQLKSGIPQQSDELSQYLSIALPNIINYHDDGTIIVLSLTVPWCKGCYISNLIPKELACKTNLVMKKLQDGILNKLPQQTSQAVATNPMLRRKVQSREIRHMAHWSLQKLADHLQTPHSLHKPTPIIHKT